MEEPMESRTRNGEERATANAEEVARFEAMADAWWDEEGAFRPLHRFNAVRVDYVRQQAAAHFGRETKNVGALGGVTVLDVGCGGGLFSEPMRRLGADVTAIDPGEQNIRAARAHAETSGLAIGYRVATPEDLVKEKTEAFDLVLAMEVVEHVADLDAFLGACGALVKPGGAFVLATLNRTVKSFMLGKVGAEYLLRWLPKGTHDWKKFVKPSELGTRLRASGLRIVSIKGVAFDAPRAGWALSDDPGVNYLVFAVKG